MMNYSEIIDYLVSIAGGRQNLDGFQITEYEKVPDIDDYKFWNEFYDELRKEHRHIYISKTQENQQFDIEPSHLTETAKLVAWIIWWLNNFSKSEVLKRNNLPVILEITSFLDNEEGYFWRSLIRSGVLSNDSLYGYIKYYLSSLRSRTIVSDNVPFHEREIVEKFNLALKNKEWDKIGTYWKMFNNYPILKNHEVQMLRLLDYFRRDSLIEIYGLCNDLLILMSAIYYLRVETSLFIGMQTDNEYLEFSVVNTIASRCYGNKNILSKKDNKLLSEILIKVSINNKKFTSWMLFFNEYPSRFPNIQVALGMMLAKTKNKQSLKIYIKTMKLSASPNKIDDAVSCFSSFIRSASDIRKKELWKIAYKCWRNWNFGNDGLYAISYSQLDLAVTGYYKDCCTADERNKRKIFLIRQLNSITNNWYKSITDLYTQWYINISIFQLIEHSTVLEEEGEELSLVTNQYIPTQFYNNNYINLLIR